MGGDKFYRSTYQRPALRQAKENRMRFVLLYKGTTVKGSNYYKLMVEIADGIWEDAVYFGNTAPRAISKLRVYKDGWIAEIQKHTSRSKDTGRFIGKRVVA